MAGQVGNDRRYTTLMGGEKGTDRPQTERTRASSTHRASTGLVPSRQQYFDLKRQHPDAILLFRLGDFYETFDDDAKIVARDARITLTTKNFGRSGRSPMAGTRITPSTITWRGCLPPGTRWQSLSR